MRRISGDEILSGTDAPVLAKYQAKVADNFPSTTDRGAASSNPACFASESAILLYFARDPPNQRGCGAWRV